MDIGDLKKAIAELPDRMQVRTTDSEDLAWSVLRANIGLLEDGEEVFIISRFVRRTKSQVKES